MQYYRTRRAAFRKELARYYRAAEFWRCCGPKMRKDLLRCLRYSNRIPVLSQAAQAHPDYLVHFRTTSSERPAYGFVEVKGPRESLRPTQKRFFPELVTKAGQRVWVARVESSKTIRFARFNSKGQLEPCSTPGSRSCHSSSCAIGSSPKKTTVKEGVEGTCSAPRSFRPIFSRYSPANLPGSLPG